MSDLDFVRVSAQDKAFLAALHRHYTKARGAPPGKKMVWRIEEDRTVRGYVGLGEPPYKLAARRALGIADARPLPRTVLNFVYRLEAPGELKASAILKLWHVVAAAEWAAKYGWAPEHWETMVDPKEVTSEVPGACFRRAGYRSLGMTTGRSVVRTGRAYTEARTWVDASPKLVLYRGPLARVPSADRTVLQLPRSGSHTAGL